MGIRTRIRQLENDLTAQIVVGKEKKEVYVVDGFRDVWEEVWAANRGSGDAWKGTEEYGHHEIQEVNITQPDTEKREKARVELQKIYDNSKWYQALIRKKVRSTLKRYKQLEQKPQSEPICEDDDRDESGPKMCERGGRGY